MDRGQRKGRIADILNKITPKASENIENSISDIIYNVIGFLPITECIDNGLFISNLAYSIAQKNINTCIVDFKVFYPNIYQYLDAKPNDKGKGLLNILKNDKEDIRTQITVTKYKQLYLLSPSPYDLVEDYIECKLSMIERVINELKEMFDVVLIDIPNNPPLEFCIGAMKYIHRGFFTSAQRTDTTINMMKLLDFAKSIGVSTAKFSSVIFLNTQDVPYDYDCISKIGFNISAKIPLVKNEVSDYLAGKLYIKDSTLIDKNYVSEINKLVDLIISS